MYVEENHEKTWVDFSSNSSHPHGILFFQSPNEMIGETRTLWVVQDTSLPQFNATSSHALVWILSSKSLHLLRPTDGLSILSREETPTENLDGRDFGPHVLNNVTLTSLFREDSGLIESRFFEGKNISATIVRNQVVFPCTWKLGRGRPDVAHLQWHPT